jgi:hypothetical protein
VTRRIGPQKNHHRLETVSGQEDVSSNLSQETSAESLIPETREFHEDTLSNTQTQYPQSLYIVECRKLFYAIGNILGSKNAMELDRLDSLSIGNCAILALSVTRSANVAG